MKNRPASSWPVRGVDAVRERVAAAQDRACRRSSRRRGEADVRVDRDRPARRRASRRGRHVVLVRAAERRAAEPCAARSSAPGRRASSRSQASISIRMRRATRYVPPREPALRLVRPTHTCSAQRAVVVARLRLFVPSLKPIRLRGVLLARGSSTTCGRSRAASSAVTTPPRPMRARLRTAWNATCGSSAQAWTQRSPPLRAGSSCVAGERAAASRSAGRARARPKPVAVASKSAGPEAEGDREPRRRRGRRASPVSAGGACGCVVDRARRAARRSSAPPRPSRSRSRSRRSAARRSA